MRLAINLEVEQARLNLKAANERLLVTDKMVAQAGESTEMTKSRFKQGLAFRHNSLMLKPRLSLPACVEPKPKRTSGSRSPQCAKHSLCHNSILRQPTNDMKRLIKLHQFPYPQGSAALALALCFTGCGEKTKTTAENNQPVAQVHAQSTEAKTHVAVEEVVGTVRPKLRSDIEAKVSGRIEQMLAVPGQQVKRGDLLAQLDAREIQAKLDQATASRDQAESDLGRYSKLITQHAITQQEFEATQSRARIARAAVTEAETMLGYTKIIAPFDGVITSKLADVGDLAAPGKPLLAIEDPQALRFEADVPEAIIARIKPGAVLPVRVGGQPEISGTVTEISPAADPNSRTFLVKLDLPQSTGLRGGLFGRVAVPVGESSVLRVPQPPWYSADKWKSCL